MSRAWRIGPGAPLHGRLELPGDKSISHRALLMAALAEGPSRLYGVQNSEDCRRTAAALSQLGVALSEPEPNTWHLAGTGGQSWTAPKIALNLGNSGTAMRLLCGVLSGRAFACELIGDTSLSARPMNRVVDPLRRMGAVIRTEDGHAPICIEASNPLHGHEFRAPIKSAQVKSALILAGLHARGQTVLHEALFSRDHTERMLPAFGASVERRELRLCVEGGQRLQGAELTIPRDLSSAAFFIVAGSLVSDSELHLPGVGVNPTRDAVLRILTRMGADIEVIEQAALGEEPVADLVVRAKPLQGVVVDTETMANAIDEFPILCVAAACAEGTTTFIGLAELRLKESDRVSAMAEGLGRLGVPVTVQSDAMTITGREIRGGEVDSAGDHRIAMAFAVAGLVAKQPVTVTGAQWAATSFPDFAGLARSVGMELVDV